MCPSDNPQNSLKDKGLYYIPRPKILNFKNSFYHSLWWWSVQLDSVRFLIVLSFFWFMHCAFLWCVYFKLSTTQNSLWLHNTGWGSFRALGYLSDHKKIHWKIMPIELEPFFFRVQGFSHLVAVLGWCVLLLVLGDFKEDKILNKKKKTHTQAKHFLTLLWVLWQSVTRQMCIHLGK